MPAGWASCQLGDLLDHIQAGKNVKCDERPPEGEEPGLVKISAVTWGKFDELESKTLLSDDGLEARNKIQPGDLLISRANTLELVGAPVIVHAITKNLYLSDKVLRLDIAEPLRAWALACLKSKSGRSQIEALATGNQLSMRNISQDALRSIELPLPPLAEQKRIAQKLDALLAQVDTLKARIDAIPALLKRFRQSVISHGVSGSLAVDQHASFDTTTWRHMRAEDVCTKVQSGGTPKEGFTTEGIPFLKVYNIVDGLIDFEYRPQYIAADIHQGSCRKSITSPGDVLMNIVGPPLGKIAVVPQGVDEWNINQAITLFRPSESISSAWIHLVLLEGTNIRRISQETKGSAGQVNISLSQCRDFVFPIPPTQIQDEIVRRVEQLFTYADQLEAKVATAQQRINTMTQSLLAKAFRGELVPQDPSDEPASVLLERIRTQRAATPKPKRGRKKV
nr:restriction endonuclease subunit S [Xanthomonas hortorum]